MAAGGTYLPPVVVEIVGDAGDLIRTLAVVKASLKDLAATTADPRVRLDGIDTTLGELTLLKKRLLAATREVTRLPVQLGDRDELIAQARAIREIVKGISPIDVNVDLKMQSAKAMLDQLAGDVAMSQVGRLLGGEAPTESLAGAAGGGILQSLLGTGSRIGWALGGGQEQNPTGFRLGPFAGALGLPAFGSILSMGGFGAEHLAMTGLGTAGSIAGGVLGGGLLAGGALGVGAVGMGTDLAGIGQASGDIRNVVSAQDALNQAIAVYGPASQQAAQAQAQLNYTLSSFNPVARGAVLNTANLVQGFKSMFDQLTGGAEKIGAQIIGQAVTVGQKFLPTIGKYATENMGIMQKDLQPLFSWLENSGKTGGLGIFTNLERIFQSQLPTGIHALTQGIELFAKTINVAAGYTGPFLHALDRFLTKENTSGFSRWSVEIGKLIGLFRTWLHVIIEAGRDLIAAFKPALGAGREVGKVLGDVLAKLGQYLRSTEYKSAAGGLFGAHFSEIKSLGTALTSVIPVVEGFGTAYMHVASAIAGGVFVPVLKAVVGALSAIARVPVIGQIIGIGVALGLIIRQSKVVQLVKDFNAGMASAVRGARALIDGIRNLPETLTALKGALFGTQEAGEAAEAGEEAAAAGSLDLETMAGPLVLALAGIALAAYELATHWRAVWHTVVHVFDIVRAFVVRNANLIAIGLAVMLGPIGLVAGAALELATHWRTVWAVIRPAIDAFKTALLFLWHSVVLPAWNGIDAIITYAGHHIVQIIRLLVLGLGPIGVVIDLVWTHWQGVWHGIQAVTAAVWGAVKPVFEAMVTAFKSTLVGALDLLKGAFDVVWGAVKLLVVASWDVMHTTVVVPMEAAWHLLSQALTALGSAFSTVWNGIRTVVEDVWHAIQPILSAMESAIKAVSDAVSGMVHAVGGIAHGIGSVVGGIGHILGLAEGGIVSRPTLAVVGEAGPEMVVPLAMLRGADVTGAGVAPLPAGASSAASAGMVTVAPQYHFHVQGGMNAQAQREVQALMERNNKQLVTMLRTGAA